MSENTEFTFVSDDGEGSENKNPSVNPAKGHVPDPGNAADEGGKGTTGEGGSVQPEHRQDTTGSFKERLDRMRRRERERSEAALRANNEAWEKRFKELEDKVNAGQKPKALRREDFASDDEFLSAKRQNAMEELMNAIDKRNADRESVAAEERARQEEASEYQRRFAERFNDGMKKTLSEDQQKRVVGIVNDEDSAINVALSSKGGEVLQNWLMTDCENPADVILYLEDNAQKMDLLLKLSPRKQVAQLDILERHLARSRYEASRKGKNGGADDQNRQQARKVPVMGLFGGSTQAVGDTSQLSDTKRVAKLIKAMRKR